MIAGLYNIPTDPETFQRFSFYNRDQHDLAVTRILETRGVRLTSYLLDPIPPNNVPAWLYQHQASHNEINGVLGLSGQDLSVVDFNELDEVSAWIDNHALEHVQWGKLLGLG